jgi:putative ABC transport system substrate-binding protein
MPVIGFLHAGSPDENAKRLAAFRKGLGDAGFVEGQNVAIEYRWAQGKIEELPTMAADLIRRKVVVITTPGSTAAAVAAKAATATIPVVFSSGTDPVALGLVASLNRPGGNATGITSLNAEVAAKRLGLLREMLPKASRYFTLVKPTSELAAPFVADVQSAATSLGIQIEVLNANSAGEIDAAFAAIPREPGNAMVFGPEGFFYVYRTHIAELALRHGLPTMFDVRDYVDAGGLASYGSDYLDVMEADGQLCRPDSQGRKARRPSGPAGHQIRTGHQPQDRQGARDRDIADAAGHGRRGDRMKRREFMALAGGVAAVWPLAAWAEPTPKVARIGMLIPAGINASVTREVFGAVRQGLADLGYVEGRDVIFEQRGGDGSSDRLAALAAELVNLKVDLIVAIATPAARAAQRATATIPIVVGSVGDPVQDGLVASLSHPGGNITGTTFLGPELVSKQLALFKELLPAASRVAVIWNPRAFSEATTAGMVKQATEAAKGLGLELRYVDVPGLDDFDRAIADAANGQADALFQFPNPTFYENRKRLVELVARYRLPAMYNAREFVVVGGLIGYGASPLVLNRRTAFFIDRILKGAKPADLPVEQPTTFDFAINRAAAKTLGINIPPTLLAAADEVIE